MENLKSIVEVDTIVGKPIETQDGTTLIPVSKVSFGFGSGGAQFDSKDPGKISFSGGGGAGVSISPVSFIVVSGGQARVMTMSQPVGSTLDKILNMAPDVVEKVKSFFKKSKDTEDSKDGVE